MEIKLFEEAETLKFQIEENERQQQAFTEWVRQIKELIKDAPKFQSSNHTTVEVHHKLFINLLKRELQALKKTHVELTTKFKSL